MKRLLQEIIPGDRCFKKNMNDLESAAGRGLVDTTRGALGHWLKIHEKKISFYQIITPSTWEFSLEITMGTEE